MTASAGITSVTEGGSRRLDRPFPAVADQDGTRTSQRERGHQRRAFGGDTLAFTDRAAITGSYDALSGVLSTSRGTAASAFYQAAACARCGSQSRPAPIGGGGRIEFTGDGSVHTRPTGDEVGDLTLVDDATVASTRRHGATP